jgi:PAS domain S-box-containing protein
MTPTAPTRPPGRRPARPAPGRRRNAPAAARLRFERIAALSPDVVFLHDLVEDRIVYANPQVRALLGYAPERLSAMGSGWLQTLCEPAARPEAARSLAAIRRLPDRETIETLLRLRHADGSARWVSLRMQVFSRRAGGRVHEVLGIGTDVTARIEAQRQLGVREQALEGSRYRLEIALGAAGMGTWEWDLASGEVTWDERAFVVLGFDPAVDTPSLRAFMDRVEPDDRERHEERLRRAIEAAEDGGNAEGATWRSEFRYRMPDGEIRWIANDAMLLSDEQGRVTRIIGTSRDVTDRRRNEERLHAARAQAEEANAAKDRFLAVLSHELRTPLTPVLLAAQSLAKAPGLSPDQRRQLAMIERNVRLEVRLIDDLLDVSRIQSGKLDLTRGTLDIHDAVRIAAETCADELAARNQALALDLNATRPIVDGDAARLQQVLWNLLKNAIKFSPDGGHIRIATRDGPQPGSLQVEVTDDGIGIEPERIGRVFDAFEQGGEHVTRRFGGMGLGLAICKVLVELHGGSLAAASAGIGRGASFTLTLPAPAGASMPRERPAAAAPRARSGSHPAQDRPLTVLLVDDHQDTAEALAAMLQALGWQVSTAPDVRSALDAASRFRYDVVVSDIGLPDASGHQLVRSLKAHWPGHPLNAIALSGYGRDEDVAASLSAGFSAHLTKPVDAAALVREIRVLTDRRNDVTARRQPVR